MSECVCECVACVCNVYNQGVDDVVMCLTHHVTCKTSGFDMCFGRVIYS